LPKKAHVDHVKVDEDGNTEMAKGEEALKSEIKTKEQDKKGAAVDHLKKVDDKFEAKSGGKEDPDKAKEKKDKEKEEDSKIEPWEKELKNFKKAGNKEPDEKVEND